MSENAWADFDGETEPLQPHDKEHKIDIPHARIPKPNGVLPLLPQYNVRAAHSDQLLIIDNHGKDSGDDLVADRTIANLRACKDKPLFIGCGFSKPHSTPEAPQEFYDLYDPAKIALPPDFAAWPLVPPGFPKAAIRMRNAYLFIDCGASESEAKEVIRAYLASISWVDHNLGRVQAELDVLGLRDNTVIVFIADHGPAAANGAMMFDVHADPLELTNIAADPKHAHTSQGLSKLIAGYSSA